MTETLKSGPSYRTHAACVILLLALVVAIYARVVTFDAVGYDDPETVFENPHIRGGITWPGIQWAITSFQYFANWFPVTWLSHMIDVELFGLEDASGHHATSILLHALNVALLYAVLYAMTGAAGASFVVAALFAVHPQHVETVAWISERKGVLSTTFWLLAMAAYVRYAKRPSGARYVLVTVLLVLGLMAKPMLLTLPFVFLLLDYWPLRRFDPAAADWQPTARRLAIEKLPLIACVLVMAFIFAGTQRRGGALKSVDEYPLSVRLANAVAGYGDYLSKTVWPSELTVLYPHAGGAVATVQVVTAAAVLLAISAVAVWRWRRWPYLFAGWFWFVGALVPVSQVVQLGSHAAADRYVYVPHIGLFIAVVWLARDGVQRFRVPRVAVAAATALIVVVYGAMAFRQTAYWRDSIALYTRAIAVTENNRIAHNNLGHVLADQGRLDDAIAHYEEALRIKPDYVSARMNYGAALLRQGRWEDAIAQYEESIAIDPEYAPAYANLGNVYMQTGRFEDALKALESARDRNPDAPEIHNSLGAVYFQLGDYERAVAAFARALEFNPAYAKARRNLAAAQARLQEP